ncbi:hypothetical protein [Tenacibaculum agarivorans]|uniref:hypothetical protein n=1 Tax=Tenacibaculum agarivorans TaxID=1908389 RepID=UPI00094BAE0C|nr:hypothetical protein [Tenacibaculum agarivorans]
MKKVISLTQAKAIWHFVAIFAFDSSENVEWQINDDEQDSSTLDQVLEISDYLFIEDYVKINLNNHDLSEWTTSELFYFLQSIHLIAPDDNFEDWMHDRSDMIQLCNTI